MPIPRDFRHTEETRARMRAATRRLWANPEYRAAVTAAQVGNQNSRGYHHTEETCAKNSAVKMGHAPTFTGPHTPESRAQISAALQVPIGSTRSGGQGYVWVKAAEPDVWEYEHRVIWERAHGPIPEGCLVHHINGDRADNRPENLEMMPGSAHAKLHQLGQQNGGPPPEPTPQVQSVRRSTAPSRGPERKQQ